MLLGVTDSESAVDLKMQDTGAGFSCTEYYYVTYPSVVIASESAQSIFPIPSQHLD